MDEDQKKIQISRLLGFTYHYLSYRPRTKKETERYLKKKAEKYNFSAEIIEAAMASLLEEGLVNDESFIESFVYSRTHNKPKGTYAITAELMQKGVPRSLVENYLANNPLEEESLATTALRKIWNRISTLSTLERTKKATNFLRNRGFQYDTIKKTIEELSSTE